MSLLRGIVRTAVVSGTASAVNGRVARRQAARFAEEDARTAALRHQALQAELATHARPVPPPPGVAPVAGRSSGSVDSVIEQLRALAELRAQGVLTDAELAEQKARILA